MRIALCQNSLQKMSFLVRFFKNEIFFSCYKTILSIKTFFFLDLYCLNIFALLYFTNILGVTLYFISIKLYIIIFQTMFCKLCSTRKRNYSCVIQFTVRFDPIYYILKNLLHNMFPAAISCIML